MTRIHFLSQIVHYTAGGGGYQTKVTYKESQTVGSDDSGQLSEPPVPIVLVRSPQHNTSDADNGDSLFINGVQASIYNPKRNILHGNNVHMQNKPLHVAHHYPSHNKGPVFLGNNFQAIETAHYFVPKLQPKAYVQLHHRPQYYSPPQYSTNFLTSHPDIKTFPYSYTFPEQKPIRFPATTVPKLPRQPKSVAASKKEEPSPTKINEQKSETLTLGVDPIVQRKVKLTKIRKPKLAKLSQNESKPSQHTVVKNETGSGSLTTNPLVTTLPPLLPAFHPDYRPPVADPALVTLEDVTEAEIDTATENQNPLENVPRFKHSALYSESLKPYKDTYNNLLPAFDPEFKKGRHSSIKGELLPAFHKDFKSAKKFLNFVTPLPDDTSEFKSGLNETSEDDISQVFLPHHNSSFHPVMSMTQILYSMNKSTETEEDKKGLSEMEEMEIRENMSEEAFLQTDEVNETIVVTDVEEGSAEGSGDFDFSYKS